MDKSSRVNSVSGILHVVHAAPNCPRCDYDLSGETSRWEELCPTRGVCPECGLEFAWGEVLNPALRLVPGFVEHTRGRWKTYVAAWRTWWWAFRPWVFWSKVRINHVVRVRRALLWVVLLLAPFYVAMATPVVEEWFQPGRIWRHYPWNEIARDVFVVFAWPFVEDGSYSFPGVRFARASRFESVLCPLTMCVAWPLLLLALPFTRSIAKVHSRHVWRASIYTLWWLVPIWAMMGAYRIAEAGRSAIGSPGTRGAPALIDDVRFACVAFTKFVSALEKSDATPFIAALVLWAWLLVWWSIVIGRVFRLPRPALVWAVLAFTASLAGFVALVIAWILSMRRGGW